MVETKDLCELYTVEYPKPGEDLLDRGDYEVLNHLDRAWTITIAEGELYAIPGVHTINALGYITTTRPWVDVSEEYLW